ncbi:MAG: Leu/Ile/Val-binding protein, partial [Candidatus Fonsibacter ubiquis]
MKIKITSFLFASIFAFSSLFANIVKANEVKIGVLLPLTGPVAQIGLDAKAAIETAVDIINNKTDLNI